MRAHSDDVAGGGKMGESEKDRGWRFPLAPYRLAGAVLRVPDCAIALTLDVFSTYAVRRLESVCFWYGDRDGAGDGVVRAVVVPEQTNTWGNYHVSADAMEDVAAATRHYGWRNLSQLHTHPGSGIRHSPYDDEHANSRRALSVVFPFYGRRSAIGLSAAGVHEWQDGSWQLLPPDAAASRIVVVGDGEVRLIDTRRPHSDQRGSP